MNGHARFKRALLMGTLAASVAVVAFATVAPSGEDEAALLQRPVIEPVVLAVQDAVLPAPDRYLVEERFERGDTLQGLLARLGVEPADAQRAVRIPSLRFLRPGYVVAAQLGGGGELLRLSFLSSRVTEMVIERWGEGFRAQELPAPLRTEVVMRAGEIRTSLFGAADAAGMPDAIALQIADIFAGDVDFHRELRRGDRFAAIYEQHYLGGRAVHTGRVLAAEFVNEGRALRAVHYAGGRGASGYYAPDGSNLRKAFLRSPLEFTRISSGFGMRRHPIHRSWRAHAGIDYAAPTGTRVRASGNGWVEFAGWKGGYGKTVILRHRGRYSTLYAHLSRLAPSARRGARVDQGDVIGHVGATGWATGPHLHYEFRVAGRARNPFAIAMPAGEPVPAALLPDFTLHAAPLVARLELLGVQPLARQE